LKRVTAAPAVTDGARTFNYGELAGQVAAFSHGLRALGTGRAERVGIYLEKRIETVVASFGTTAAGAVFVPINPLLKRVLSFAIGRLPAALQPAARKLASRFASETETEEFGDEAPMSPANLSDLEELTDSFDHALAEAVTNFSAEDMDSETLDETDSESDGPESRRLEVLGEGGGQLIDQIKPAGDGEDLEPAIEQFVPAILGALRLGISLIGRPKVVGFLAKYLGGLIKRWTGPQLSGPLSNAIVDTGLRLISLENEDEAGDRQEAAPVAMASVVEDTVRRGGDPDREGGGDRSPSRFRRHRPRARPRHRATARARPEVRAARLLAEPAREPARHHRLRGRARRPRADRPL
jgi:hypothetical protein